MVNSILGLTVGGLGGGGGGIMGCHAIGLKLPSTSQVSQIINQT